MKPTISSTEPRGPRGGPRTPGGKSRSRRNALKHGLSSGPLLPDVLGPGLVDQYYQLLRVEWNPTTQTEDFFLREMARHQATLVKAEMMEDAILRRGARGAPLAAIDYASDASLLDAALAGAGTSEALELISRYRRTHERAYYSALAALRDARSSPAAAVTPGADVNEQPVLFASEEECEAYLTSRIRSTDWHCPQCSSTEGTWMDARRVWQCRKCRRQIGIRAGTVMESSRVSLLAWFRLIAVLHKNPDTSLSQLAEAVDIPRRGTLRRMTQRIRLALKSPTASTLLAGLDRRSARGGLPRC